MKIMFMSADTGGGHRASSMALAAQFLKLDPSIQYELYDIWTKHGVWPYSSLVDSYTYLSARPRKWRFLYHLSNSAPYCAFMNWNSNITGYRKVRRALKEINPDAIVSVHPTMTNTPQLVVRSIRKETGKRIPIFTVVTDLGSGHATWFTRRMEKIFVASGRMEKLARWRGWCSRDQIVNTGLPIRPEFGERAAAMGPVGSPERTSYQKTMRSTLGVADADKPMCLIMGGGEGVGSLGPLVDSVYARLARDGVDATLLVVCGRNEELRAGLETKDWAAVQAPETGRVRKCPRFCPLLPLSRFVRERSKPPAPFLTLTTSLAGNVQVVVEEKFGDYRRDPGDGAKVISAWLRDENLLEEMSRNSARNGHPSAAADISKTIYERVVEVKNENEAEGVRGR
ncbi:hypothetical protein TeGR_g7185 [Tetraparma gracilis]|uniref:Diacylglycerol glucosyltransferase N-terminal domain-containing protein n=1 Tax=Tetraparma gracilis TaxID=2962635 RepID=A0ABQ6MRY0_9STRA|nr:hypothetical protein TeGR_g7185 [Tetraparma gracilis]